MRVRQQDREREREVERASDGEAPAAAWTAGRQRRTPEQAIGAAGGRWWQDNHCEAADERAGSGATCLAASGTAAAMAR
ncbi:hypothetical protein Scep_014841 [Stephania cephalantha]|uniref:Uncharacterized protein n=1 Tax=Stephania cephalantha TaxID=152367 RepID=A0AAP0P274_9MAGN